MRELRRLPIGAEVIAEKQGTVWAWLIGPFIDAWLKFCPNEQKKAHGFLGAVRGHLDAAGLDTMNDVFDAIASQA